MSCSGYFDWLFFRRTTAGRIYHPATLLSRGRASLSKTVISWSECLRMRRPNRSDSVSRCTTSGSAAARNRHAGANGGLPVRIVGVHPCYASRVCSSQMLRPAAGSDSTTASGCGHRRSDRPVNLARRVWGRRQSSRASPNWPLLAAYSCRPGQDPERKYSPALFVRPGYCTRLSSLRYEF